MLSRLTPADLQDIQVFISRLSAASQSEKNTFAMGAETHNSASWVRFSRGVYNHPLTWWIGVFQVQQQLGVWGTTWRGSASVKANSLKTVLTPVLEELKGMALGKESPLVDAIIKFNLEQRKADLAGRIMGGLFTNYATTGGRFGAKNIGNSIKLPIKINNFILSAYGAAIKGMHDAQGSLEAVVQAILTGTAETPGYLHKKVEIEKNTSEYQELLLAFTECIDSLMTLAEVQPKAVDPKIFCQRPENRALIGLCS